MRLNVRASAWLLLVFPWIYPFASGPSPSVEPWLITLGVTGVLMILRYAFSATWGHLPATIASAWVWAALLSATMALLQYFGMQLLPSPWVPTAAPGEAYGALRQRNQFATLTLIGLAALLPYARLGVRWRYLIPAVLLLVMGNAVSASRIGAIGLMLMCVAPVVWPSLRSRRTVILLVICMAGYASAAAALPGLLAQWKGIQAPTVVERIFAESGCGSRKVLWSNVSHLIAQKPWLGWGWGELDYAHYVTLYPAARFCDILDNAHMLPLHVAVELGLPAAILATLAVAGLVAAHTPWHETQPYRQMAWIVLAAILLHSMVEYPLWYGPFCLAVAASVAVLCHRDGFRVRWSTVVGIATCTGAAALLGLSLFAAWDYWRVSQIYLPYEARAPAYQNDPLSRVRESWLFQDQINFAELTTTQLTRDNAAWVANLAGKVLHYSPEPRVIQPLIESLILLGRDDDALMHMVRFRAAFPDEYARWYAAYGGPAQAITPP